MLSTPFSGYSVFAIILVWTASALGTRFVLLGRLHGAGWAGKAAA